MLILEIVNFESIFKVRYWLIRQLAFPSLELLIGFIVELVISQQYYYYYYYL